MEETWRAHYKGVDAELAKYKRAVELPTVRARRCASSLGKTRAPTWTVTRDRRMRRTWATPRWNSSEISSGTPWTP